VILDGRRRESGRARAGRGRLACASWQSRRADRPVQWYARPILLRSCLALRDRGRARERRRWSFRGHRNGSQTETNVRSPCSVVFPTINRSEN